MTFSQKIYITVFTVPYGVVYQIKADYSEFSRDKANLFQFVFLFFSLFSTHRKHNKPSCMGASTSTQAATAVTAPSTVNAAPPSECPMHAANSQATAAPAKQEIPSECPMHDANSQTTAAPAKQEIPSECPMSGAVSTGGKAMVSERTDDIDPANMVSTCILIRSKLRMAVAATPVIHERHTVTIIFNSISTEGVVWQPLWQLATTILKV